MPNSNSSLAPVMVIFETPLENILIMTLMPLVPFTALHYNIWCHLESFGYTAECLCTCLFQLHSSTEASEHLGRSDSKIKPGMSLEAPTFSLFKKKKKKGYYFWEIAFPPRLSLGGIADFFHLTHWHTPASVWCCRWHTQLSPSHSQLCPFTRCGPILFALDFQRCSRSHVSLWCVNVYPSMLK